MQKVAVISLITAFLVIAGLAFRINPFLLSSHSALAELHHQQGLVEFFRVEGFSPQRPASKITALFRSDLQRSGSVEMKSLKFPVTVTWQVPDLFGAVHTASKSTPAVDETGIYFGTDLGLFYKIDHAGKIQWRFRSESDQQGIHGSALLDENFVYFGTYGGWFYCLDKANGDLVWSTHVANAVGSSPLIVQDKIIFAAEFSDTRNGYLVALNVQSGKKIWASPFFEEQVHSSPTLSVDSGLLGVGSNNGIYWGIDLESGQVRWKYQAEQPIKGTGIYHQGLFCFTSWSRRLHCIHEENGEESFNISLEGTSQSSPALDVQTNTVFVSSSSGYLFKISLDQRRILQRVSLKMDGKTNRFSMPSPLLIRAHENLVVMPCEDTKVCVFRAKDLSLLQKLEVGGMITGSFAAWNQSIYFNVDSKGLVRLN